MIKEYFQRIFNVAEAGDAREESYYSSLEHFITEFALSTGKKHIQVTTLPKKTEGGNPDFRIWDGKQNIVGYIEAKKPGENLDFIEQSEQLKRYRNIFPNLILTDFFEFRLYRNGQPLEKVLAARPFIIKDLKTRPPIEKEQELLNLLEKFLAFSIPKTYTAESLAIELAKRTRFLKEQIITEELQEEEQQGKGFIISFFEAFRKYLIAGLTKDNFADLYSQTLTYGLFAARTRSDNGFNRKLAYDYIPQTIGILRDVFQFISLGDLPQQMEWTLDDIASVLATADVNQILHKFYQEGKGSDPIVYFYETFLEKYNPQERERRGVYYTPEPVVSYIVRSLNIILKEQFGRPDGFADSSVTVLDPAAGTLTFLAEASKLAVKEFIIKYGEGGKEALIREHVLRDFYALELMMAPYAIGHLKMSFLLEELGYKLKDDERFKLYLTNTLEMEELEQTSLPGMSSLAEESHLAGKVKKQTPILVIMGNPPYSGISANIGEWISKEIKEYYQVDGKPLGEKNPKWLQDDYVKFIRFAQWKIDQAGEGILGFITNHSYLDNPTFRGMRQSLMKSFNQMYFLDLHGNTLKKEHCPDGSKDENVFDIRQGVAIALFIKKKDDSHKKFLHAEQWGLLQNKHDWLRANDIHTTEWQELKPHSEFYFFVPRDEELLEQYQRYPKITAIFPVNGVGMTTARDEFVIDRDKNILLNRIRLFKNSKYSDDELHNMFQIRKKQGWSIRKAWNMLQQIPDSDLENYILPVLYRPFDIRWIFYHDSVVWRTVKKIMRHTIARDNLEMLWTRPMSPNYQFSILSTRLLIDQCVVGNKSAGAGISYVGPLYLYPDIDNRDMFSHLESEKRKPNLNPELVKSLTESYGREPSPEEIFHYIYGILYSNIYRTRYAQFLKSDFPRVPFTANYDLFLRIGQFGKRLVDLHLLKSAELVEITTQFQGAGDNRINNIKYDENNKVYINDSQYFEGIEKDVWEYYIGGYQVLDKWLKERKKKGSPLSLEDIKHFCQVAIALKKTIAIQAEIDKYYTDVENSILPISLTNGTLINNETDKYQQNNQHYSTIMSRS